MKCELCNFDEAVVGIKIKGKNIYLNKEVCEGCLISAASQFLK